MLLASTAERARLRLLTGSVASIDPGEGRTEGFSARIAASWGVTEGEATAALRLIILFSALGLALSALIHPIALLLVPLGVALVALRIGRAIRVRTSSFEGDYPTLLVSLASAVRTGRDPLSAFLHLATIFTEGSEMRRQIAAVGAAIEQGDDEERAIKRFGATITLPDIDLFTTAFILARRQGSGIAECLHRLTRVTRQRQSFRRRVASAVAMQRLSAYGIALCTVAIGVIQGLSNPEALRRALEHPVGSVLLLSGVLLIVVGIGWMMLVARSRVSR